MASENSAFSKESFQKELFSNILPYWFRLKPDRSFVTALSNQNEPIPGTPLGLVMVSRLLWTYSRAYRLFGDESYAEMANHARNVMIDQFEDYENGGYFWSLDEAGTPLNTDKLCYGQAFSIYAFSEHFEATGNQDSLDRALSLFRILEEKAWDFEKDGYLESFNSDWTPLEKMKLGAEDLHAPKTMNNHLHLIEAFANLHRIAPSKETKETCRKTLRVIADRIILPDTPRFGLFYDMDWNLLDPVVSPGHDIEGSWLLWESAEIVGDHDLEAEFKTLSLGMAELVLQTGIDPQDHGIYNEFHLEHPSSQTKDWWPQAEGVVGFYNAYQLSGDVRFLEASKKTWNYIQNVFIDQEHGEWIWGVNANGEPLNKEKAGPWKSAYHNGRACFEMITRLQNEPH